ncbi:MAG TPA: hypothetical protein VFI02_05725, partial [Armatimonadota bacterium]|nr:hypothetical protein [Armatimonadota bacterium]
GGIVEATGWLKMRSGVGKGMDAKAVNRGLDLAGRAENRGNLGRGIPLNPSHNLKIRRESP